jgi:anti-anti-sigma factor
MILAHDEPAVLTIAVEGPATMTESPAVKETASERLARGVREVRIDLRDCTMIDSTFSGTILAIERMLVRVGGTLTLVSPSPKVVELLHRMGIEDFYRIQRTERTEHRDGWVAIAPVGPGIEKLRRAVIDAHEELARVPGPQAEAFRGVADELRRDDDGRERAGSKNDARSSGGIKCAPGP